MSYIHCICVGGVLVPCDGVFRIIMLPIYVPFVGDSPCQNNGSCYDGYCSCPFGYSGRYCEIGQ